MRTLRSLIAIVTALVAVAGGSASIAAPGDASEPVPAYDAPPVSGGPLPAARAVAADAALRVLLDDASPTASVAASVRRLAGIGQGVLPRLVGPLRNSGWRGRSRIVSAIAEMDAPEATPILVAAARDPSFAVREAAVTGLGKTGDARGAASLTERSLVGSEPSWRVRAAAATAVRRAVLRHAMDVAEGSSAICALMDDPDPDVALAALQASGPLALPAALTRVLAIYTDGTRSAADREKALTALRTYRVPAPEVLAALRRGFLQGTDPVESVRAARACFDMQGAALLADDDVSAAVLRQLTDDAGPDMRAVLVSIGPAAQPWIVDHLRDEAARVAAHREDPAASPFESLLDALLQIDESAGIAVLRDVLVGPSAGALHLETRLIALRKAWVSFAAKMGSDLRALLRSPAGRDVYPDALRAVAASGGDDVAEFVESALRDTNPKIRDAALDVLDTFPAVRTPPALAEMAASAERVRERMHALTSLGRRDRPAAAKAAMPLLMHADPDLRAAAIAEIGASRDATLADVLRKRLRDEDGRSPEAARTGPEPPLPPAAVTESDTASTSARNRRNLRSALLRALRAVAGAGARADLLDTALHDDDVRARETAVQELIGIATPDDAVRLIGRLGAETDAAGPGRATEGGPAPGDAEPDSAVRTEILRLVATFDSAEAPRVVFARQLADARTRSEALRLLAEPRARVVPPGLEKALSDATWDDDQRASALRILERSGSRPGPAALARLARESRTLDLCAEACRSLAAGADPAAAAELARLIADEPDPARRSLAAKAAGDLRAVALVPTLVALLESSRPAALAATVRTSPDLQLYRECALALGRIGTDGAGLALVEQLLDPALAESAARCSVPSNGPFQPQESAVVTVVRALVTAVAHVDDAPLAKLIEDALLRRAVDLSDVSLDKEYIDGIARYLGDPSAFELPPRRRTAAALPLWRLVATAPPRWSPLDAEAWQRVSSEAESQGRLADAERAMDASVAVANVEDAGRSVEERTWEQGKLRTLRARVAAAEGRSDDAARLAASVRELDPNDADLAYLQGVCFLKLGNLGADAVVPLRFAASRDAQSANAPFQLAWIAERTTGADSALPLYAEAIRIDSKRVEDMGRAEYLTNRRGRNHRWGHFYYWQARALAAAGRADDAGVSLQAAVLLDDRFAAQALADEAFRGISDRAEFLSESLHMISDEPLR
ncbi:MAG: HEAT repeat domain-containing protein [Planctomycetes bacterium]|nr:HEAT repeat domain-containing protein [Planctomycetota bacterium]